MKIVCSASACSAGYAILERLAEDHHNCVGNVIEWSFLQVNFDLDQMLQIWCMSEGLYYGIDNTVALFRAASSLLRCPSQQFIVSVYLNC